MRVRHSQQKGEKIELQMTPMIDIVFQLLVFFIMTFKIVAPEGDFTVKMPLAAPVSEQPDLTPVPPLTIRLMAQPSGQLANIQMNQRNFQRNFDALNEEILALAGGADAGPGGADALEVEIDADYNLRFEYVIDTITAVSGYVATTPDGRPRIIRLVEKIKFAPPRPDPNQ